MAAYVHVLCDRLDNFFGGSYPTGAMHFLGKQHLNAFLHIAAVGKDKILKSLATCCHLVHHTFRQGLLVHQLLERTAAVLALPGIQNLLDG